MINGGELRVDWFALFSDLKRHGFSTQTIADEIRVAKSTLLGWKQGAEPKHGDGELLIAFWCRGVGRSRDQLPMIDRYDWRA